MINNITALNAKIPALFFATFFLIYGILWSSLDYSFITPTAIAILTSITIAILNKKTLQAVYIPLLTITPLLAGHIIYQHQINSHVTFYKKTKDKTIDTIATIRKIKKQENNRAPLCITVSTEKIKEVGSSKWKDIKKNICFYTRAHPHIKIADTIEIKNIAIKKPKNNKFIKYLIKENIAATIFTTKLEYILKHRPLYSTSRWFHTKKEKLFFSLKEKMSPRLFSLFASVFLGNKNFYKQESQCLKTKFKAWGILHILARSGLHLIIFLLLCELLLKLIPICFYIKQIILLILSIIYLLLSWPSISFIRAFSALILYKVCPFLKTKPDLLYILAIICIIMLIFNPIQIFFLDFQLSFLLTCTLAIFNKTERKRKRKTLSPQ